MRELRLVFLTRFLIVMPMRIPTHVVPAYF